jgi:hypothetical protein
MRALAFKIVSQLSAWIILLFQSIGNTGARTTGKIGYALMAIIDKKKLSLYEELLEPEVLFRAESPGHGTKAADRRFTGS